MEENSLKCNLCGGDMKYIQHNGSHIWVCENCPNVQFEYVDDKDYIELGNYLKGNE